MRKVRKKIKKIRRDLKKGPKKLERDRKKNLLSALC